MKKETEKDAAPFRCSCAIGDLSEMTALTPVIKTKPLIQKEILKKDDLKKEDSNHKK